MVEEGICNNKVEEAPAREVGEICNNMVDEDGVMEEEATCNSSEALVVAETCTNKPEKVVVVTCRCRVDEVWVGAWVWVCDIPCKESWAHKQKV